MIIHDVQYADMIEDDLVLKLFLNKERLRDSIAHIGITQTMQQLLKDFSWMLETHSNLLS